MAFNADSYYRNKARRQALGYLAEARQRKAAPDSDMERIMGAGYNAGRIESAVRSARLYWHIFLTYRDLRK